MPGVVEHFKKGTFEEQYWIPAHDKRRESAAFKKNKLFVRDTCGAPCWVCGAANVKELEVHHVFEWAFWNAMDPQKVTNILNAIEFYDEDYTSQAKDTEGLRAEVKKIQKAKPIIDTPDDIRNLVVLCVKHHRLKLTGIHTITFPLWLAICAVPTRGGVLTKEQLMIAVERVRKIDEELGTLAGNNYEPQRL